MVEAAKKTLKLQTNDGEIIDVDRELWLKYAIATKAFVDDNPEEEVVIVDIPKAAVEHIVEFMTYLSGAKEPLKVEKPLRTINMKDNVNDPWYATFIEEPHTDFTMLEDLINGSNSIDFKELLTLSCAAMGAIVRKTRGDIKLFRKTFSIENDFTPEEEADVYTPEKVVALAKQWEESQPKEEEKKSE